MTDQEWGELEAKANALAVKLNADRLQLKESFRIGVNHTWEDRAKAARQVLQTMIEATDLAVPVMEELDPETRKTIEEVMADIPVFSEWAVLIEKMKERHG